MHACVVAYMCATRCGYADDKIWAIDNGSDLIGIFDSQTPGTWNPLTCPTGQSGFINGLEFDDMGRLFGSNGTGLFVVDPVDGCTTTIGPHGLLGGIVILDMSWNPVNNQMYGVGHDVNCSGIDRIYTIDLGTGAATYICDFGSGTCSVGLAIDSVGVGYLQDIVTDRIFAINLSTCASSYDCNLPFDANFGQGLTINTLTDQGYIIGFNNVSFKPELWLWDVDPSCTYSFVGVIGGPELAQKAAGDVEPNASVYYGGTFCITGTGNGIDWSWDWTNTPPGIVVTAPPPGASAADLADAFVSSIRSQTCISAVSYTPGSNCFTINPNACGIGNPPPLTEFWIGAANGNLFCDAIAAGSTGCEFNPKLTFEGHVLSDCLDLSVDQLVAGSTSIWTIANASEGLNVALVYGFEGGHSVVNGTNDYCATFEIAGVNASKLIGQSIADANGIATVSRFIPGNAQGLQLLMQAAQQDQCPDRCMSNLLDMIVQ